MESLDDGRPLALEQTYVVYKRRWYIVFVIFFISFSNAAVWITFAPVADKTAEYYDTSLTEVNWFSLVFPIAAIPFSPVSSWLLDTWGLRTGIISSALVNLLGCLLRYAGCLHFFSPSARYGVALTGQLIAACAQPVCLICPAKVASVWFHDSQRAVANMMASMANPLGVLIGNALAPAVVHSAGDIPNLLLVMTAPAALGFILSVAGVCSSQPPTPPTSSAEEATYPFIQGLKKCMRDPQLWLLALVFGLGVGMFTGLSSLLEQILCAWGFTDVFAGTCGALVIGAGVLGAAIVGAVADKTKRFEESAKICYSFAAIALIFFTMVFTHSGWPALVAISMAMFGLFGFALYPICLELGVECTFPVAEATSSGILVISGQLLSIVLILAMQGLAPQMNPSSSDICGGQVPQNYKVPMYCVSCFAVLGALVFTVCFRCPYKRLQVEKKNLEENINSPVS